MLNWHPRTSALVAELFSGLSTSGQWFRPLFSGPRLSEEFGNVHVERCGKLVQIADGWVFHATFNPADVCPVNVRIHSKLFLRHVCRDSQSS